MNEFRRANATIVEINGRFLFAVISVACAYAIWPTTIEWWAFGFLSVVLVLVAVSSLIGALRLICALYYRDKALAEILALGKEPKSAELANTDTLKDAGMVE